MRRGDGGGDIGARAEAGVEQAPPAQFRHRLGIDRQPLRLAQHRPVPVYFQPSEISEYGGIERGAAARAVDILDAKAKAAAARAGTLPAGQCRKTIADVQEPGRRRSEACRVHAPSA